MDPLQNKGSIKTYLARLSALRNENQNCLTLFPSETREGRTERMDLLRKHLTACLRENVYLRMERESLSYAGVFFLTRYVVVCPVSQKRLRAGGFTFVQYLASLVCLSSQF